MNGLHPRFAGCRLVSIVFDEAHGAIVRLVQADGVELVVTAAGAFIGSTLAEVRRLERPAIRRVK